MEFLKKETKDEQKMSDDWEILRKKIFFKIFYTVCKENIHVTLIVTIDQIEVILILGVNNTIYKKKGIK